MICSTIQHNQLVTITKNQLRSYLIDYIFHRKEYNEWRKFAKTYCKGQFQKPSRLDRYRNTNEALPTY